MRKEHHKPQVPLRYVNIKYKQDDFTVDNCTIPNDYTPKDTSNNYIEALTKQLKNPIKCQHCNTEGFYWHKLGDNWVLCTEDGKPHRCEKKPKRRKYDTQ